MSRASHPDPSPGPLPYGMVGGGPGAFIGEVHRMAAALDGEWQLVAGAFSSTPERSRAMGRRLGLDPDRVHGDFRAMAATEAERADGIRAVVIVTPNHLHHRVARAFLEAGIHVICDKPLANTVDEARELVRVARERGRLFCVTYNYSGYPMVREAREQVRSGALGTVRKVVVEYTQGWLATLLEADGHKQAEWRQDPSRAGMSSALADIGTHAHHLVRFVTGLEIDTLFADLGTVVEGRELEDDATVLLRFSGGARGLLHVSQISTGERNGLRLRVYGTDGGLDWRQEAPERLRLLAPSGDERVLHRGSEALSAPARAGVRLPAGHPEGFIEAFANLYRGVARALSPSGPESGAGSGPADFPTVEDGAEGVRFVHAAVRSAETESWIRP